MDADPPPLLAPTPAATRGSALTTPLARLLLTTAIVAVAHGYSLTCGLWLDDHLHWQRLREARWTYHDLVGASTLDAVGTRIWLWGDADRPLHFYRPVAFAVMKAEYALVGWRAGPMHALSLAWHIAVACLVGSLAKLLLRSPPAGTVASLLYAAFPGHAIGVYWIACQTELLVTFFALVTVLAYARWSGWAREPAGPAGRPSHGWLLAALLACAAAMGCRENALAVPGILIAGDLLTGRARPRRTHAPAWLLLAILVGLYLVLRDHALRGTTWPHRPYLVWPTDPEFALFVWHKILYYLAGLFLCLPVLPGSAMEYFAERTVLLPVGAAVGLLVLGAAMLRQRRRPVLLSAVWMLLALVPLLPVEPAPHHLYLPGVGSAILWTAALGGAWGWLEGRWGLLRRAGPHAGRAAFGVLLSVYLLGCALHVWQFTFSTAAEKQVVADVLERGDPLRPGDELFFINLPMMASWVTPAIETATGNRLHDLKGYVLTLSDEITMMLRPSRVIPLDRHSLRLEMDPPGWLAGAPGRFFAEMCGIEWPVQAGRLVPGAAYDVLIERVDAQAASVTSLRFEFHEPIDKPGRHFYFGSPYQMAYPLHFDWTDPPTVTGPPQPSGEQGAPPPRRQPF